MRNFKILCDESLGSSRGMTQGLGILDFFGGAGVFSRNSRFFIRNSRIPKLALLFKLRGSGC